MDSDTGTCAYGNAIKFDKQLQQVTEEKVMAQSWEKNYIRGSGVITDFQISRAIFRDEFFIRMYLIRTIYQQEESNLMILQGAQQKAKKIKTYFED